MKKRYLTIFFILILAFFAGNLSSPEYINRGIDFFNSKLNLKIPHFWNIRFRLGLDLQGGTRLLYQADLLGIDSKGRADSLNGLRDVIERRVNLFGVQEPLVQVQGERLIVELAGIKDPAQAIEEIGKTPFLEFKEQKPEEEIKKIEEKRKELEGKSIEEIKQVKNWYLAYEDFFQPTNLTGKYLKKAELNFDQTTLKPLVSLYFDEEGSKIFEDLTAKNIGRPLAIYIDNQQISTPIVQEKISGGKAQITGNFTVEYARELARNLNAGALPVPIKLVSQQSVGPTLGKAALSQSFKAGILGFLAVILFMVFFYRLPGLISGFALIIYVFLVLALFKLIPVTLTLAGISGFILSIGMAVDANILVFARMKEELMGGKGFSFSLEEGFRRAWPSIRDGNLTTLIVAVILFFFGTSFVKGFALTLSLGVVISMFSALVITKNFLKIFENTKLEKINWLWR